MNFLDLNFSPGIGVQAAIRARYGVPVNSFLALSFQEFLLVVSFGRYKFHINEGSVGFILQATIGGVTADFRLHQLSGRVFWFVVSSQLVGFHLCKIGSFSCDQYKIYFNLWSGGGPNWRLEYRKFLSEQESEWTVVHKNRKNQVHASNFLSGANSVPLGLHRLAINKRGNNRRPPHHPLPLRDHRRSRTSVFHRIIWPRKAPAQNPLPFHHVHEQSLKGPANNKVWR
jgi:hypothetical protein